MAENGDTMCSEAVVDADHGVHGPAPWFPRVTRSKNGNGARPKVSRCGHLMYTSEVTHLATNQNMDQLA